ncbi:type II secretion system protein GspL [Teredinibacter haidensis]|uniref:type II secretion system protein GspL n=1 Tax=Teredinibacter haidensis TaxID=2731755 RepID=UPI000948ADC6|nr:type II secretion system protein GspL [Teredinibacter haidensis]
MAEKVLARQTTDGLWQWRIATVDGNWSSDLYHTGDDEALVEAARAHNLPVTLLLNGSDVACSRAQIEAKEKRHLAKLLPYELEEKVIDNIDDIHLAFISLNGDQVALTYIADKSIEKALQPLLDLSCDVRIILPDYLTLRTENQGVTFVLEEHRLIARLDNYSGFAIEPSLAPMVLAELKQELDFTATVNLVAESEEQLARLASWLPAAWRGENGPEVSQSVGGIWDWISPSVASSELNLRCGKFSRQLPIKRWYAAWKTPLIAVAAAYLVAICVTFFQYQSAKSEQKNIVATMNDVYMQAVPKGRPGDPEGRLETLVKGIKGGDVKTSNLMVLLAGVADTMTSGSISISSFRYNADQRELLMNIEGSSFAELETLRTGVENKGLKAELLRVEAKGDRQSARMKIVEASE